MTTDTTDWIAAAAEEIATYLFPNAVPHALAAIIRRHYAEANAGRQAAVERLVDAAESLRAEVAKLVNDPDQTERPGLDDAYCRTISALDAVHSLPLDPQDAALTAEREALLRRAVVAIALLKTWLGTEHSRDAISTADAVLADAERLWITGYAK